MSVSFHEMSASIRRHPLAAVLLLLVLVKLGLIFTLGPTLFEDSRLYLSLGQDILSDPSWWRDGQWSDGAISDRMSRPYGYPLMVAVAKLLAGVHFDMVLMLGQAAASLAVLWLFGTVLNRVLGRPSLAAALVLLCGLSGSLLFDLALLTDSFYGTLFDAVFLLIGWAMLVDRPLSLGRSALLFIGVGGMWALSITLRDVGYSHTILPLAGVVAVALVQRQGWKAVLLYAVAFAAPVYAVHDLMIQWNLLRTGHAFFSITGGVNWLWPSINMLDHGLADPFACADAVCLAAGDLLATPQGAAVKGMGGVFAVADAVQARLHLDPVAFGQVTLAHFLGVVIAHPLAYLGSVLANLQFPKLAHLIFDPVSNANELALLHSAVGHRIVDGIREVWLAVRHGHWMDVPVLVGLVLLEAGAVAALAISVAVSPVVAWKTRRGDHKAAVAVLYFWCMAAVFIGSYCLIHMEMRHAMPAVPLILTAFGYTVEIWRRRRGNSLKKEGTE